MKLPRLQTRRAAALASLLLVVAISGCGSIEKSVVCIDLTTLNIPDYPEKTPEQTVVDTVDLVARRWSFVDVNGNHTALRSYVRKLSSGQVSTRVVVVSHVPPEKPEICIEVEQCMSAEPRSVLERIRRDFLLGVVFDPSSPLKAR